MGAFRMAFVGTAGLGRPSSEAPPLSSRASDRMDVIFAMTDDALTISPGPRFKSAMVLAILADALQIVLFPMFVEGALSPADDVLDLGIGALMIQLLGWHWEFLPSFLAKLVPGVDLVPLWTLAVANVYRKSKRIAVAAEAEDVHHDHPKLQDPQHS
jgi:hypothetical protein